MTDIDDLLDDRMKGGGGDFPPWFDETDEAPIQEEGDVLQGRVTHTRDDPFHDPAEDEGPPKPILHVEDSEGSEWSTRTHSVLVQLIRDQEPEVGDYVRIQYDGNFKTNTGQVANDYQLGVVRAEEIENGDAAKPSTDGGAAAETPTTSDSPSSPAEAGAEMADPSEIEEDEETEEEDDETSGSTDFDPAEHTVSDIRALASTIDDVSKLNSMLESEKAGPDRKTAKHAIEERVEELDTDEEPEEEDDEETETDLPGDVIEFAQSLMSFHEELELSELDEYLNETRDFDVDPADVAEALDNVEVDGDTARLTE